jgi:methionyl-tRNA formyltransferase
MRILYVTCAENGLYGLRHMIRSGKNIVAAVTIDPRVAAAALVSGYVDISNWVREQNITLISLNSYTIAVDHVKDIQADVLVVNGWNRLIPSSVLKLFPQGGLGIHAGHPPIGLGRAPLVWNILKGHRDLEVYVFHLSPNADDGAILARQPIEITAWDTVKTLYEKVMMIGCSLFEAAIDRLTINQAGESQALEFAQSYPKRTPSDGLIDFSQNETAIHNFVRSQVSPYPGAFTYLNGVLWKITEAVPFDAFAFRDEQRVPGKIVAALPSGLVVLTGGATIWVRQAESSSGEIVPCSLEQMERLVGLCFTAQASGDDLCAV